MLERLFRLRECNTNPVTEILAGITTFLTMCYILAVNPAILASSGMPRGAVFTATAISTIIATLMMGFYANMPFALAPGMGINAFFTYVVVIAHGYTWQEALTATLLSGLFFLGFSLLGLRSAIINGLPDGLKAAIGMSIGFMIASMGLVNAGIIVKTDVFLGLADLRQGPTFVAAIGIILTAVIMAMRIRGGMILGILLTSLLGVFVQDPATGHAVTNWTILQEQGFFSAPPSLAPIFFHFSLDFLQLLNLDFLIIIITFLFVDIFDSLGTFVGILNRVSDVHDYTPSLSRCFITDSVGTVIGACLGTSTVTTYAESSVGVAAGGRSGLTAVSIAACFIGALFFSNLFLIIPSAATTPAMIMVGMFLVQASFNLNFSDISIGLPAMISTMITALTWSISDGLAYGWISYFLIKVCTGKFRDLNSVVVIISIIFILKAIFL
ncbi:MAG: NCS2 family permease [Planctomycetota bacterium]|jgi:AGZA family xanthine/uracil permease-like MFS transporter|nr:NCS2 family permease [Planctomycetota bacterium]